MKSSLVSEQLSSWEVDVTPNGEVRNGLLVDCQSFLSQRTAEMAALSKCW